MKSLMKLAVATASLISAGLMAVGAGERTGAYRRGHRRAGCACRRPGWARPAFYYGPGFYPPGPCDAYGSYYDGDCGYAVYNGPIVLGGINVGGPHYYRWYNGAPLFWYRGGWHNWNGWNRANFGWDRGEGFGWRGGHWDRGWGNAHWHGAPADFRGGRDFHDDRGQHGDDFRGRDERGGNFRGGGEHHDDHGDRGGHGDHGDHNR